MAVGNPLMGTWRKKLGSMVFYRRKGEQVVRAYNGNPQVPETYAQRIQWSRLLPCVAMHRTLDGVVRGILRIGETQYNSFIKRNLRATRPEYLDVETPAVYPGTYPKLVPPMPRIGLGNGMPILLPWEISVGRFNEPLYSLTDNNSTPSIIGVNHFNESNVAPKFSFPRSYFQQAVIYLTNYGIDMSAASGSVQLDPFVAERFINFIITGEDNIHTGFLNVYYAQSEYVVNYATYCELGDIVESSLEITWITVDGIKTINELSGSLTDRKGKTYQASTPLPILFCIALVNAMSLPNLGNASSVILSRRNGSNLEVSTSKLLLSYGTAQAAYLSLFSPEVEEAAALDYQRHNTTTDEQNLGLDQ